MAPVRGGGGGGRGGGEGIPFSLPAPLPQTQTDPQATSAQYDNHFTHTFSAAYTSGEAGQISAVMTYAPTSGTGTFNSLKLAPTINQTGGANGITRGLYINPTLTSAADFRAIEITAGKIAITTGSNKAVGQATLSGGTVTVSNTLVTASSLIFISDAGGTITNLGFLSVGTITAGTSFVINSSNVLDASTVNWMIIN